MTYIQLLALSWGGTYVNDFTRFGRLYKTYIQAEPEYRVDESQIGNFFIKNNKNEMVSIRYSSNCYTYFWS